MSEQTETPKFNMKKAALIATPFVAGGLLLGQAAQHNNEQNDRQNEANQSQAAIEARQDAIKTAINAAYDKKAIVGEKDVTQGMVPIDEAEAILRNTLGADVYNANRGRLYDYLLDSANLTTFNPGEKLYVIEVELDQKPENGNEYIITDGSGGFTESSTEGQTAHTEDSQRLSNPPPTEVDPPDTPLTD